MLIFMQDNSASMKHGFKNTDSIAYKKSVSEFLNSVKDEYDVKEYSFGNEMKDTLQFKYTEPASDLNTAFETVLSTHENNNIGAVIMSSDGIYNKGNSPVSQIYPFKGSVYTIGIGDTTIQKDALVARVFANKIIYLGDKFAIKSDIAAYSCEGNQVTIAIFDHNQNRTIATQTVNVSNSRFSKSIESILDANAPGVKHYSVTVSKVDGEQNILNNTQDVYVEVLDSKENVLILANAPHPDINAFKEALSKNKNYKIDIAMADKPITKINDYNLIILHNLPSATFNASSILDQAKSLGISLWFIVGSQTAVPIFNQYQTALQIVPRAMSSNEVQAEVNKDFTYFTINQNDAKELSKLPPLSNIFGDYKIGANAQTLLFQKIGSMSTQYPLWCMQATGLAKIGVLAGEGIWRWRFYDFLQHKNNDAVDNFIIKTAQYLSVKHDKKQFRTQIAKSIFNESEPVTIDAELYNENYELINNPDVSLVLTNENNKRENYTMNKNSNSYSLNMGNLSAGKYTYTASTIFNGKSFSSTGYFTIVYQNIEEVNTKADFGMLHQLAKNYNGEFLFANQFNLLKEKLKENKRIQNIIKTESISEPLINWKWLFGLLIVCLGAEWYLRKTNGSY